MISLEKLKKRRKIKKLIKSFLIDIYRVYDVYDTECLIINRLKLKKDCWLLILQNKIHTCFTRRIDEAWNLTDLIETCQFFDKHVKKCYCNSKDSKYIKTLEIKHINQAIIKDFRSRVCYNICIIYSKAINKLVK